MTNIAIVLPMRANSQTIARKNLRTIGADDTLASRAFDRADEIVAALGPDHTAEIIVTTDDPYVKSIALSRSYTVHDRDDPSASQTLADAVFEVTGNMKQPPEIVVVLQSTSPWSSARSAMETIDEVLDGNAQSATTVTPLHRLAWRHDGIPLHESRKNRQEMYAEVYVETGAIHVCRDFPRLDGPDSWLVSAEHALIPTPPAESIDVDEPEDLLSARRQWQQDQGVLIVCLADPATGGGHLRRAALLAEELELHCNVVVYASDLRTFPFARWASGTEPYPSEMGDYALVVLDVLDDCDRWAAAAPAWLPILALETVSERLFAINELLPSGVGGAPYATVGPEFRGFRTRDRGSIERVLVCLGATDASGMTSGIVETLAVAHPQIEFVVGPAVYEKLDPRIADMVSSYTDTADIARQIWLADVAIIGRGRMQYECAYLGTPFIAIAQNEKESGHLIVPGGLYDSELIRYPELLAGLIAATPDELRTRSIDLRLEVDGHGVERVVGVILHSMGW